MIFIIMGISGCGKGTQAELLAKHFGLVHLSTGELFRREQERGTPLGKEAYEKWWGKGLWPPMEVVFRLLEPELERHLVPGFVLEGWPRTVEQARFLDNYLSRKGLKVDKVFLLETSGATTFKRLKGRATQAQQAGEKVRLDDASDEAIRQRIKSYQETVSPILAYYQECGVLERINNEGHVGEVAGAILDKVGSEAPS